MNSTQTTLVDLEKNDIHQSTPVNVEGCIGRFDSLRTNVGSEESRTNTHTPLEGGMKGWSTVAGGCCLTFVTTGLCGAFGVYQDYYARFYLTEYPPSQIGWIGSVQFCLVFMMSMPAGLLFDAGYFHWMVGLASMVYVLALSLLSLAKPQDFGRIFATHGVVVGISLGFLFIPPVAVLSHHFKRHHTLAVGIITSSSSCGATVFPWLLNYLIQTKGFKNATQIVTVICFGMLALANFLMRTEKSYPKQGKQELKNKTINIRTFKEAEFALYLLAASLSGLGIFFVGVYIQLFANRHNVAPNLVFYIVTIFHGSSFVGRVSATFMGRVCGVFNMSSAATVVQGILVFSLLGVNEWKGIVAVAIAFGLAYGIYVPASLSSMAALAKSVGETGTRMGIINFFFSLGLLGFSPISGALLGSDYHWAKAIVFHGICLMASGALMLVVRGLVAQRRGNWNV